MDDSNWIDGSQENWKDAQLELTADMLNGCTEQAELSRLLDAERAYGEPAARESQGFILQGDAFQAFWMRTINNLVPKAAGTDSAAVRRRAYALLVELVGIFRVYRQSQLGFFSGYGVESIAHLRSVVEYSLCLAGVARGVCTQEEVDGFNAFDSIDVEPGGSSEQTKRAAARKSSSIRMKALRQVTSVIEHGNRTGLTETERSDWRAWLDNFNLHAHGSRLARAAEFCDGVDGIRPPAYHRLFALDDKQTAYVNVATEACWLMHRAFPLCQLESADRESEWARSWTLLDVGFQQLAHAAARAGTGYWPMLGKVIGQFMDFKPQSTSIHDLMPA